METFLECETTCREAPPGHVFVGSLAEIDPRKVTEVVRGSRHKKPSLWKRARLSLFMPQPQLPSFIQIHPRFRDLLAKTNFQIVTIIGDPIGIGSPIIKKMV